MPRITVEGLKVKIIFNVDLIKNVCMLIPLVAYVMNIVLDLGEVQIPSINLHDCHNITDLLLIMALNTLNTIIIQSYLNHCGTLNTIIIQSYLNHCGTLNTIIIQSYLNHCGCRRGRDRMVHVVGFSTTYMQSVSIITEVVSSWRGVLDTTLCDKHCQ
jgi:hypothetical protein